MPSAERILVILENPNSPMRPFSSASSVERPMEAFFANSAWLRPSFFRLAAIWAPKGEMVSTCLIY